MTQPAASARQLVAGAATTDISPDDARGVLMAGFGVGRRSRGMLRDDDPLEAGVLYVSDGDEEVALVTVDCIGLLSARVDEIRAAVKTIEDPQRIIVCATHTHSGPDTLGIRGPAILKVLPYRSGVDPAYMDQLVRRVAACVDAAKAAAQPASMKAASFDVPTEWTRNDRDGGDRYDLATALAFDADAGGGRIATMLNFASHPEALWEHNRLLSPDFPGAFRRRVRERVGGAALYFSGPLGAMLTPNVPGGSDGSARQAYVEKLGCFLADLTISRVNAASEWPSANGRAGGAPREGAPPLQFARQAVHFDNANWRFRAMSRLGFIDQDAPKGRLTSEIAMVDLGPLRVVTAPGEVCPELGHRIHEQLATHDHFALLCLAGDELGYMLEPHMFDEREYRYERTMSLGPDTADVLLAGYDELAAKMGDGGAVGERAA